MLQQPIRALNKLPATKVSPGRDWHQISDLWNDFSKDDNAQGGGDNCNSATTSREYIQQDCHCVVHLRDKNEYTGGIGYLQEHCQAVWSREGSCPWHGSALLPGTQENDVLDHKRKAHRGVAFLPVCPSVLNNLQLCLVEAHQAQVEPRKEATLHSGRDK